MEYNSNYLMKSYNSKKTNNQEGIQINNERYRNSMKMRNSKIETQNLKPSPIKRDKQPHFSPQIKISASSLSNNEKELYNICLEEYKYLFPKILIIQKDDFISILKKLMLITLSQKKESFYFNDSEIDKIIKIIEEDNYKKDYNKITLLLKSIKDITKYKKFNKKNYIPHCNDNLNKPPIHNCGNSFYDLNQYLLCLKCNYIYEYSSVLFHCTSCNSDYFTEIYNQSINNNYQLVTWEKYHCDIIMNDTMKCPLCLTEPLYICLNSINNNLICLKCNNEFMQNNIKFKCIVCNESFKSNAKIYNPQEYKIAKYTIKKILFDRTLSYPSIIPCCKIDDMDVIKTYKFIHKKNCNGIIYEGTLNNIKVVLCSVCQILCAYDKFLWSCPICQNRFRIKDYFDKLKENALSFDFTLQNNDIEPNKIKSENKVIKRNTVINNNGLDQKINGFQLTYQNDIRSINEGKDIFNLSNEDLETEDIKKEKSNIKNKNFNSNLGKNGKFVKGFLLNSINLNNDSQCSRNKGSNDFNDVYATSSNTSNYNKINKTMNEIHINNDANNINTLSNITTFNDSKIIIKNTRNINLSSINIKHVPLKNQVKNTLSQSQIKKEENQSSSNCISINYNAKPVKTEQKTKNILNNQKQIISKLLLLSTISKENTRKQTKLNQVHKNKDSPTSTSTVTKATSQSSPVSTSPDDSDFNPEDYKIIRLVDQGSYAKVYWCEKDNVKYALKKFVLNTQDEANAVIKECSLIQTLSQKEIGITNIFKIKITKKHLNNLTTYVIYLLTELGIRNWEREIQTRAMKKNFYKEKELIKILKGLAYTFAELQRLNISHKDIRPKNILLFQNDVYKISDFGLINKLSNKDTEISKVKKKKFFIDKSLFLSPILYSYHKIKDNELIIKHNEYKSDVYSLGICLIYAMTLSVSSIENIRELNDMNTIKRNLSGFLTNNKFSNAFMDILYNMIDLNEDYRCDFIQLENILKEY